MNFNMKNRIWKNLSAMSMAFFMTGMVLGGCGQTTVYAAELAYESVEFEEHSETEETGIEESGTEESGIDESDRSSSFFLILSYLQIASLLRNSRSLTIIRNTLIY